MMHFTLFIPTMRTKTRRVSCPRESQAFKSQVFTIQVFVSQALVSAQPAQCKRAGTLDSKWAMMGLEATRFVSIKLC
ncbi:hypothetical protein [Bradyrhizobium neotropicale]|uniref:hypothetical protein n=1 Tax=Bradyrhizobium neotropicale TaxID=1497615 RepID=UPI001AD7CE81|nr:hypothetical protein [Bradyrhizobium neotropicale]MBO4225850.1 hypothetical protein [Bradyrhizobium neotropicale]